MTDIGQGYCCNELTFTSSAKQLAEKMNVRQISLFAVSDTSDLGGRVFYEKYRF